MYKVQVQLVRDKFDKAFHLENCSNPVNKCYLLGAGASVGHTDAVPLQLRPSKSDAFFLRGRDLGILDRDTFPDLYAALCQNFGVDSLENLPPNELRKDIEDFLGSIANESPEEVEDDDYRPHMVLGHCVYFIYELLRFYQIHYRTNYDNYQKLALHYHDHQYSAISLNYDVLFEAAIQSSGLEYYHGFQDPRPNEPISIAKIHGSISFHTIVQGITYEGGEISKMAGNIYNTSIRGGDNAVLQVMEPNQIINFSSEDFIRSESDWGVPLIIPPAAGNKKYEQFDPYKTQHQLAKQNLHDVDKLVIIGCSLRNQDDLLLNMLRDSLDKNVDVKIVARSSTKDVADTVREIQGNANIDTEHKTFDEYADYL